MRVNYEEFLREKIDFRHARGYEIEASEINPILFDHQRDIVQWMIRGGRRALFAAFGLGKTPIQIEACRILLQRIQNHERCGDGRALIVMPLGVRQEFKCGAEMLGVPVQFIRSDDELGSARWGGIYLTNYESVRDGKVTPALFDIASLDEASVLRSYGSKTFQAFLDLFESVQYKFVATATPSPNRYKELIHYAGFLGIMDTGQALTRFFQRDTEKAGNLTLYPHKETEFWLWLASWAVFVQKPSDLGYSDKGYELPPLDVHYHEVAVDHGSAGVDRDGQSEMFRDAATGLAETAREKRDTLDGRVETLRQILAEDPDTHCLIWHDLEAERHAIKRAVPTAVDVYGSQDLEERERRIIDFGEGRYQYLATKPEIAGSGCNFQRHCHRAVFLGIGYKFNDFIQAIHRIQRFQQPHRCRIDIIYAESEQAVLRTLLQKWRQHEEMVMRMTEIIRKHGLNRLTIPEELERSLGSERLEVSGEGWTAVNNDCVEEMAHLDDESVDQVVTSIPFSNHYEYTPSYNDFGHTDDNAHFWQQMDYLTPELLRVLKPGRLACIHVKDRILFGNVTGKGAPTVSPFHAEAIFHYQRHGFDYMGLITVVTDVVRENNQTYRLGWSEQCKDGTKMGVGSPEYVVLVRKPQTDRTKGYADEPVRKDKAEYSRSRWQVDAHAFWRSSGDRHLTPEELAGYPADVLSRLFTEQTLAGVYDYEHHVRIGEALDARGALPSTFMALAPGSHHPDVWHDVVRMRTLNGEQSARGLQNHICPLPFDIVERLIRRYSNEGELILDPFGGLMTVPYCALGLGRSGYGVELNPDYAMDGIGYLRAKEREIAMPTLFDFEGEEVDAAASA